MVAGDIYDGDWQDASIGLFFARQVGRLDRAGIPVVMVRGNHDAESVITRSITLPPSVHVFSATRASTHRIDSCRVAIHGRSFPNRAVEENLSLTYPAAVPGWFNLGLLHTSCTGHAAHATYARARSRTSPGGATPTGRSATSTSIRNCPATRGSSSPAISRAAACANAARGAPCW